MTDQAKEKAKANEWDEMIDSKSFLTFAVVYIVRLAHDKQQKNIFLINFCIIYLLMFIYIYAHFMLFYSLCLYSDSCQRNSVIHRY